MAFTLPNDLPTNVVDDVTTVDGAFFNNIGNMGNALKAAIATWGFNTKTATVSTSESTNSTSYTDLATTTDQVTVPIGSSGKALVFIRAKITLPGSNGYVSYAMSGSNTSSATDTKRLEFRAGVANMNQVFGTAILEENLTPGFTTFKLKYKSSDTTSQSFSERSIMVIPFPTTDGTHESAAFNVSLSPSMATTGAGMNRPIFDSVGAGYKLGGDTGSWSHTIGANATALIATVFCTNSTAAAVTVDGTPMTKIATQLTVTTGGTQYIYVFGMLNPPTGTKTIAVTGAAAYLIGNSVSYSNVAGFGGIQTSTGSGTSITQTLTPTAPGRVFFHAFGTFGNAALTSYSGSERWAGYTSGSAYPLTLGDVGVSTLNPISVTATNGNTNGFGGVAIELMSTIPTYSVPTWVGTGLPLGDHKANPGTSWVENVPADANLALVWISEMPSDQANTCTVTLGGTLMVEVTGSPWTYDFTSGYMRLRCFALLNPSTGLNKTIAITSNVSNYFHAHSVYYGGVTSVGTATFVRGQSGASPSTAIANSASTHLYAQGFICRPDDTNSTFTALSSNAKMRAVHNNGNGGYSNPLAVGDAYGNDGTLTIGATRNGTCAYAWGSVTIDLSPAALPTPSTPTFVGLGAGRPHVSGNYSWTETVPVNANCAILWISALGTTAVSATLGGTAMTHIQGSPFLYNSSGYSVQALYLLNPSTGSGKTLALTNTNANNVHAVVTYYGGVTTIANPTAVSTGAASEQPSISVGNTTSDHLYVNAFAFRPNAVWDSVTAYNQNRRIDHPNYSYDAPIIVGDAAGNNSTLTFSGTRNNTSYAWGGVAVDLRSQAIRLALTAIQP